MATTPQSAILTTQEAELIRLVRSSIPGIKERLNKQARDAESTRDAFELGFLWQALDQLEDATFEALNVAQSYLGCSSSTSALDVILKRAPEPVEV